MDINAERLLNIFNENKEKRICVLGTTCTGKSTLIEDLGMGLDIDEEIFPLLTVEETEYVCQTPWTEEIGHVMDSLVRTKLQIVPGFPMFGTVLLDCDLIVYLHISDTILEERTLKRNVDFTNAKHMQQKIEEEIKKSNKETIVLEIESTKRKVR